MVEERRSAGGIDYVLTVKKVKNINLRVRGDGSVAVSANRGVARETLDNFVQARRDWIATHQARLAARTALPLPPVPPAEEALPVLLASLERVYPRVAPLGVLRPVLKGRRMKSRWGSCHFTKGTVVLNTALAAVPQELLDYVTLHELVHFLHHDHGAGFYAELSALMGDWQARRRALRSYEGMLRD